MDFQPTEERRMLVEMIGKFVQNEYPLKGRLDAGASELGYNFQAYAQMADRGLMTLVKTIDGPRKTSSSQVTPVYIETLF